MINKGTKIESEEAKIVESYEESFMNEYSDYWEELDLDIRSSLGIEIPIEDKEKNIAASDLAGEGGEN